VNHCFILSSLDSFNPLFSGDRHALTAAVVFGHPDSHHHFDCPVRPIKRSPMKIHAQSCAALPQLGKLKEETLAVMAAPVVVGKTVGLGNPDKLAGLSPKLRVG
jgi:hypothetical protein